MKRLISLLLFCLILFSSMPVAFAADNTAATLRLEKTEGTVSVENQNGRSVSKLDGMRLYSGYTVATEAESYAHISLDSTKAIKLDASSEVQVSKSGSKLELHLVSGSLLCDVSNTLSSNESLSIRTSTTITGIRGTTVFFRQRESGETEVYVLHGTITLTTTDPLTGESRQVRVTTGQMATAWPSSENSEPQIMVQSFTEEDVPGYVGIELAENEELHQRLISQGTGQDLDLIIRNAENQLQNDHEEAERRQQALNHASDASRQNSTPFFGGIVSTGGGGSGGSGGSSNTSITLPAGSTETDLRNALQNYDDVILSNCNIDESAGVIDYSISLTSDLEIPAGKTLTLDNSILKIQAGVPINNNGTLRLINGSSLQNYGAFTNTGTINLNSESSFVNYETFTNDYGSVNLDNAGFFNNYKLIQNSGTIQINSASNLSNYYFYSGGSNIPSSLTNTSNGNIYVGADGVLYIDGDENGSGCSLTNLGTLSINYNGEFHVNGVLDNLATFYLLGKYSDTGIECYIIEESTHGVYFRGNASDIIADDMVDSRKLILLKDIELSDVLPDIFTNFTLDLNGHTLTLNGGALNVTADGTLTIIDSSEDETGTITGTGTLITSVGTIAINSGTINVSAIEAIGISVTGGTFTMNGGTILVGSVDAYFGIGVNVEGAGSSFILNEGSITASGESSKGIQVMDGGSLSIAGGTITASGNDSTGVLLPTPGVTFSMENGVIIAAGDYSRGVCYFSGLDIINTLLDYVSSGKLSTTNGLATNYEQL
ncbi:MAG: FecR domain-containing protein [Anaerotignum sp.]|nr:FecR domain-containing protein [Anaerotignum sp.]